MIVSARSRAGSKKGMNWIQGARSARNGYILHFFLPKYFHDAATISHDGEKIASCALAIASTSARAFDVAK